MDESVDRPDVEASFAANQRLWDAWTAVHAAGEFYDLAGFREGGIRIRPYEIAALGDVTGKSLLHLQCHFGLDTLSWARLGAIVTGVDFSPAAIRLARELAADIGITDARFIESNVYQLPVRLADAFDIVYTSRGVLGWLPDIRGWARVVARFVRPGGRFYISEAHPVIQVFESEGVGPRELRLQYPYWEHGDPLIFDVHGSYADRDAELGAEHTEHGWDHGLGEIVSALIDAGLRIDRLEEQPFLEWPADFLVEREPGSGVYVLPDGPGELPLMFSLLASKPG
ncbi:MAG TPA: class I SAM-dependent methyltransferase [Candidatus Limnocylindrales bacterium]|nr:class I SAM-dependent methyltransferase [Candidatus Limnocylindrales bacterium]